MNLMKWEKLKKQWKPRISRAMPAVYFLYVFFLYYSLLSRPYFIDELDVFFGGYAISKGKALYASFLSQHMPFSYYIAAIMALCGARTVFQFRLGFYLFLTGLWEGIYLRHRKHIPMVSFFLMPLFYLSVLKTMFMGTIMVSEHWQGIGLVIIMLELVRYKKEKTISWACAWMISLGIMLSLGCTFASAYSVFCYFLGAAGMQITTLYRLRKQGSVSYAWERKKVFREDMRLTAVCILPFVILFGWYGITGNLENFYNGAYEIVTKYYSKYIGGLGSNPVSVVWTTFGIVGQHLIDSFLRLGESPWEVLLIFLLTGGILLCSIHMARKSWITGLAIFLSAIYGSLRGFQNFHAEAYYAQASAALSLWIGWTLAEMKQKNRISIPVCSATIAISLLMIADFMVWAGYNVLYTPSAFQRRILRCEEKILELLTEPGEEIFVCNASHNLLDTMDLELVPQDACGAVCYPYFYEMWGGRLMESIQELPSVVIYQPDESFLGYVFRDYAADFDAFLRKNYTRLPQGEDIWVSNAFLSLAEQRLETMGFGNLVDANTVSGQPVYPIEYTAGQSIRASFTAKSEELTALRLRAACFFRKSQPELKLTLRDAETREMVGEARMSAEEIADDFYSRCPLKARLVLNREYELEILIERIGGKGDLEFYYTEDSELALAAEYRVSTEEEL